MVETTDFYNALVSEGLDFFCGVPDSLLKNLCSCVFQNSPRERNVICANEGNAVGLACGYHISTGRYGVVYMQNSGEGNAVNPLLSIADPDVYSIPMLLVIGWRGEPGVHDEPQHVKQGKVTCELLEAMGIPYQVLDDGWRDQLAWAIDRMRADSRPVALVVRKGTFSSYPFEQEVTDDALSREEALEVVLDHLGEGDFVVSTTGKTSREVFEIRERRGQGHSHDFLTVGGMGHTLSIAFGMALGTDADVWCLDGDGSLIMHMGSAAVLAQRWPRNLHYVVNNNGAHESVGGQPTVARQVDLPGVLAACGFRQVVEAHDADEIAVGMRALAEEPCSAMVLYTHQGSRDDLGRPTVAPRDNKDAMMAAFATRRDEAR